ncbi:hypothetical protein [Cryobacterium sp. TMT1-2-2]|nr:hypothetical protein [Cryobacterium sp. TMT1-2-2]
MVFVGGKMLLEQDDGLEGIEAESVEGSMRTTADTSNFQNAQGDYGR